MHLYRLIFVLASIAHESAESTEEISEGRRRNYGWVSAAQDCNVTEKAKAKKRLFEHLDLDKNDSQNTRMWPLIFNKHTDYYSYYPVYIQVNLYVTSIINVVYNAVVVSSLNTSFYLQNEKAQSLTTQVKMLTSWPNWYRWWDGHFCGIKTFSAPKNMFWTPDIGIMESIETKFGTKESPNVLLSSYGFILSADFLSVTTACKMDLYRFPFDTQNCSITLQSTSYTNQEIIITTGTGPDSMTDMSKQIYEVQGEWELLSINYTKATLATIGFEIDQLIYQIIIKRRPLLYVINIIVPVFFFLVLDVISFFIDTNGSEKLSFKVTLLLSISVMLLLVNDTLPSTSDKIPLIGIYCSGTFCLTGISIMETIFVNYLMVKGAETRSEDTTATDSRQDDSLRVLKCPPDSVRDQKEEQFFTLYRLKQILTECWAATQRNQREKTSLSWTRVARIIDNTFLVLYIITIIVFLSWIGKHWIPK